MAKKKSSKRVSFSAYQIDVQYIQKSNSGKADTIKDTWDAEFFGKLLREIHARDNSAKKFVVSDEWFMLLSDLQEDEHTIYGNFKCAEYGRVADLIHADTLKSRTNPRQMREGEEDYVHFMIRKKDGFVLLQYNIKLNRSKLQDYLDRHGKNTLMNSSYCSFNICSLLSVDFIEDLKRLDKIKSTKIEITSKVDTGENEFIREMQGEMEELEATHVSLEFKAKRVKEGLQSIVPYINKYRGQRGVTSIKVIGEHKGAEKSINIDKSHEIYRPDVKVDKNNNPSSEDLYDKIASIIKGRDSLKRSE